MVDGPLGAGPREARISGDIAEPFVALHIVVDLAQKPLLYYRRSGPVDAHEVEGVGAPGYQDAGGPAADREAVGAEAGDDDRGADGRPVRGEGEQMHAVGCGECDDRAVGGGRCAIGPAPRGGARKRAHDERVR
ncbi:MAG: hypothetical protein DRJ42_08605 [Deltaproteobacteria bacterium]|nr:MAG: hypothetical protein DRJ42_08605 [Deltaproteobacteria bacterium]